MSPDSNAFGCVLVLIIVVCLCIGAYAIAGMVGNTVSKPLVRQSATTTCIGFLNWNSCNVTQVTYRPPQSSGISPQMAAGIVVGAVIGAIFWTFATGGKEG